MPSNIPDKRTFPLAIMLVFGGLASGIAFSGYLYYETQKDRFEKQREGELNAIAELKTGQIAAWRRERVADGVFFQESPYVARSLAELANSPDGKEQVSAAAWINRFRERNDYQNVLVVNPKGEVRFSSIPGVTSVGRETVAIVLQAIESGKVVLSDLYRDRDGAIRLDMCVPIPSQGTNLEAGAIILRIDPNRSLYPLIQTWPGPSRSAETLLLRREGTDALFLNELRHRRGTALSLRLPAARTALILVGQGERGIGKAVDYRGVRIIAAVRPVPNSSWILVAKIDVDEAYGPLRRSAVWTALAGILFFLASTITILLLWREQHIRFYRRHYAAALEREGLVERLDYLSRYGHDALLLTDNSGRILDTNERGAELYGHESAELRRLQVWDLCPASGRPQFEEQWQRLQNDGSVVFETRHQRKDGGEFFVEISAKRVAARSGSFCQFIIRDISERKGAEEQLRLLESAMLQTGDAVLIVRVSAGSILEQEPIFINAAFQKMTGYDLEEIRSAGIGALHGPESIETLTEQSRRVLEDFQPAHIEVLTYSKFGTQLWTELSLIPLVKDGECVHLVSVRRDISERKQAEATARLLGSIVESSDDAIASKDLNGIVLSWNHGAERIYGYEAEEIVGKSISVLIPPERRDEMPKLLDPLRQGKRIEHFETERLRKDGQRIFVSLTMSPILDRANKIAGASVIARDITQRKRVEEALHFSEERYRALAFVPTQILWTTNSRGEVVEDVPMWRSFTGQALDEIQGRHWLRALHPDDREVTANLWETAVEKLDYYKTEYRMRRHDGEYRWMDVQGVPVFDKEGQLREWVGTCEDITDRKKAWEEVRRLNEELEKRVIERTGEWEAANRELEAFAYSVSHDLRAPLRAIAGFSVILSEEYATGLPEQARHYLEVVTNNATQMGKLIDGLLAFSRLERQAMRKERVAPADLARQALEELTGEQIDRELEISIGALPSCQGDPLLLKQVFVNLLSNALKYTRGRKVARIEVGATALAQLNGRLPAAAREMEETDDAVYYVRDNGVGFDMRHAGKLFRVFQRLHSAEEFEGTGVGLANVQRIVHRHGGIVWAEGIPDAGATFYFTLGGAAGPGDGRAADVEARSLCKTC